MVKEIYSDNRKTALIIIIIIIDFLLGICSLPLLTSEHFFIGLALIISILILTAVFVFIIMYVSKLRNVENEVIQKGYKVSGTVVSIGRERFKRRHQIDYYFYWLDIEYIDRDGVRRVFQSPKLGFEPKDGYNITCDVYIYNDKVCATNFMNLYKNKSKDKASIIGLIVALVIVGIIIITATM